MPPRPENIMLGTAGHVDHGKTSLVKLLTGCWTDRLREEKLRGLTIELGFAPCRLRDERIVGVVDVPGHVDFIRNMVAGAQGVDVVILVIAADDGVMPQTREHLDLLTIMGCRNGLIALTKIDLVDEELRRLAIDETARFVDGTFLEGKPICPISNLTGEGFEGFFQAIHEAVAQARPRSRDGHFHLWIERSFRVPGFGSVVTGIPSGGTVREGDRLRLLPGDRTVRVRGLEVYGRTATEAGAGECVAVNLSDAPAESLHRGMVLTSADALEPVRFAEASLGLLAGMPGEMEDYAQVHVHVGTAQVTAHVAILDDRTIPPGQQRLVQLRFAEPVVVCPGERLAIRGTMSSLAGGRVTTLGGGRVLATSNLRLRRNRPWTIESLTRRRQALDAPLAWLAAHLDEAAGPLSLEVLARRTIRPLDDVAAAGAELVSAGLAVATPQGLLMGSGSLDRLVARVVESLGAFHEARPTRSGLTVDELARGLESPADALQLAIDRLIAAGRVQRHGEALSLTGQGSRISPAQRELCARLERRLLEAGLEPPLAADLAAELGVTPGELEGLVDLLIDEGVVVRLGPKVLLHASAVERARAVAIELFRRHNAFTTMDFRDAIGVGRKVAVPLLDHFDAQRLTVRHANRRTPGQAAREVL